MFKFNSPTPAGSRIPLMKKDKVVIMSDYAPKIFSNIRSVGTTFAPRFALSFVLAQFGARHSRLRHLFAHRAVRSSPIEQQKEVQRAY